MEFPQKTVNIKYAEPLVFVRWHLTQKTGANYAAIIRYDDFELFCV